MHSTAIAALAMVIMFSFASCGNGTASETGNEIIHTHQWGEWAVTARAACTTAGVETRVCTLNAAHTETREGTAALGHDWDAWTIITVPAVDAEGEETNYCKRDGCTHAETRPIAQIITSASGLSSVLAGLPANTSAARYTLFVNVDSTAYLSNALSANPDKYVNIDFSGSSFANIEDYAFLGCAALAGISIGNNVTRIGYSAFSDCTSLSSFTFAGTIASDNFIPCYSFPGDLRAKFYVNDPVNGTPGTYTRPSGGDVWTRQ